MEQCPPSAGDMLKEVTAHRDLWCDSKVSFGHEGSNPVPHKKEAKNQKMPSSCLRVPHLPVIL